MLYKNTLKSDFQCLISYHAYCNLSIMYLFFYCRFSNNYKLNTNVSIALRDAMTYISRKFK